MTEAQVDVLIALGAVFVATVCWMIIVITLEIKSMLRDTGNVDALLDENKSNNA